VSAGDGFLQGIDVSKWQGTDTPNLSAVDFLFARASAGLKPDATFTTHIANALKARVPVIGAYHFGYKSVDLSNQLDLFLSRCGSDIRVLVLDVEGPDAWSHTDTKAALAYVRAHDPLKRKVALYMSESVFWDAGQDIDWIANYSREPTKHYDIWQYGPYEGADGDFFKGTLSDLNQLVGKVEAEMNIVTIKAEDWTPSTSATGTSNGVLRAEPDRTLAVIGRLPLGTVVRTIAEVTGAAGDNWRLTEYNGAPAYMLRSDLVPLVAGGDPATDQLLTDLIARKPPQVVTIDASADQIAKAKAQGFSDGIENEKAAVRTILGL
jgi:hypothetical protein